MKNKPTFKKLKVNQWRAMGQNTVLASWNLYLLSAAYFGSSGFSKLDPLAQKFLRDEFQESVIIDLLMSVAVNVRNTIEHRSAISKHAKVGILREDTDKGIRTIDLSFLESCNKIIHASEIAFEYTKFNEFGVGTSLKPRLHFSGSKPIKRVHYTWFANLDMVKFIDNATLIT